MRFNKSFDEQFLIYCEKELLKINTFFDEKLVEATTKFSLLKRELNLIKRQLAAVEEVINKAKSGSNNILKTFGSKRVLQEARNQRKKLEDMKLAFSEFYLSLVLLQNYQNLNYTGFRKILKKHDKLFECDSGLRWKSKNVDTAPFYTNKKVSTMITETEALVTNELEGGDRRRAMKQLRVPPLRDAQSPWITFKVGLFTGAFIVVFIVIILSSEFFFDTSISCFKPRFLGIHREIVGDWRLVFRLYRGTFLITLFLFLIGVNVYGWKSAGVNHVLIFELDPRNHVSEQHIIEISSIFALVWSLSVLCYLYSDFFSFPAVTHPLILVIIMLLFLINPTPTLRHSARFWLIRIIVSVSFHSEAEDSETVSLRDIISYEKRFLHENSVFPCNPFQSNN